MLGCILGNTIAIPILLDHGANIELQDFEGNTAFHLACIYNQEEIVKILIEKKCSLEVRNKRQMTPIDCITNINIF